MKGKIITFEGGDCAGKGTQIKLLVKWLEDHNYNVQTGLYEPGSTNKSDIIRTILKNRPDTDRLPEGLRDNFSLQDFWQEFKEEVVPPIAEYFIHNAINNMPRGTKQETLRVILDDKFRSVDPGSTPENLLKKKIYDAGGHIPGELEIALKELNESHAQSSSQTIGELFFGKFFAKEKVSPIAQAYLFLAARNILFHNIIIPTKDTYDVTIIDRSKDSTTVYQGYAQDGGLDLSTLRALNLMATENTPIEATIVLDLTERESMRRKGKRETGKAPDFFDSKDEAFHRRVRSGYLAEAKYYANLPENHPEYKRIIVVDGNPTPEAVFQNILSSLEKKIK
jgi:thymidylate kinase